MNGGYLISRFGPHFLSRLAHKPRFNPNNNFWSTKFNDILAFSRSSDKW